jgi:uncharacterized protein (TIGR03000 family)
VKKHQYRVSSAVGLALGLFAATVAGRVEARPAQASAAAAATEVRSRVVVTVPADETTLSMEGMPVDSVGRLRQFNTPPLDRGRTYRYRFIATWRPNGYTVMTRTKTVEFAGGADVVVDMTQEDPGDRAEIRFVPTPPDVVMAMIELAEVRAGDVVYEPGCGDARITIAAVNAGASKGVGIDLDERRVAEAEANVRAEQLEDRIEIRLGDALDIKDLARATVVFLYMGEEFDLLIRPILWKQLRVGSRVVSHRFMMGDWKPDRTTQVVVDDQSYEVHLWTITEEVKARAKE